MELSILSVFGAGLLTFLSPCVLPLIPVYLGILAGSADQGANPGRMRALIATAIFSLGFTLVFALMGLSATFLGRVLIHHKLLFQQLGGILVLLLGLRFMGYLNLPFLENAYGGGMAKIKTRFHYVNVFLLGLFFAFAWTPCIGSVLGAVLTFTSLKTTNPIEGVAYLSAYSMGFAVPLLLISAIAGPALTALKKARQFIPVFEKVTGVLMVVVGLLLATDQFGIIDNAFSSPSSDETELVIAADLTPQAPKAQVDGGANPFVINENPSSCDAQDAAQCDTPEAPSRPAMLKFFSPNCPVCRQMIPTVNALKHECSDRSVELREVDISTPEGRILANNYGIRGIPVFVFVDAQGKEVSRLVGYQTLSALEQAMSVLIGEACPSEYRELPPNFNVRGQ